MRSRFTKEELDRRIKDFLTFLNENNLSSLHLGRERNNAQSFIINREQEVAKMTFTPMGGIYIISRQGALKTTLITWIKKENPKFIDRTTEQALKELDLRALELGFFRRSTAYNRGITTPPSISRIRLIPKDHPLVDLAERLGYIVYLNNPETPSESPTYTRYLIVPPYGPPAEGHDLGETLALLIKQYQK